MLHILAILFFAAVIAGSAAGLWNILRAERREIAEALGYRPARGTTDNSTKLAAPGLKLLRWVAAR